MNYKFSSLCEKLRSGNNNGVSGIFRIEDEILHWGGVKTHWVGVKIHQVGTSKTVECVGQILDIFNSADISACLLRYFVSSHMNEFDNNSS